MSASARLPRAGAFAARWMDAATPLALLLAWWAASRAQLVDPFLLPSPGDVAQRFVAALADGSLSGAIGGTLMRTGAAFGLATAICVPLGLAIARFRPLRWFFDPLISIGFPMPKVAFIPIFILWLGVFDASKITISAFSCAFTILSATIAAASKVERFLVWSALSLGASRAALLAQVVLPSAAPRILTGLQIALPISLITMIAAEMIMGGEGLGGFMMRAGRFADTPSVYAGILASGALGFLFVRSLELLRRRLLAWHPEHQKTP
ncbi:MAG TPA: ABC transporter permease [Beijerinckiaceae bacterium]|jgi:ABC-type nitrate/sulfonate/bicarbonate transport system permease component